MSLPNRFTEVEFEDDLLEQGKRIKEIKERIIFEALSNHDESLSPVLSFLKPDTDYSVLIPFELLYRSNTRKVVELAFF